MGQYSVPEHIRTMKPLGTMTGAISGHWHVYEYEMVTVDGERRTKMGPCIGSITETDGYVPNRAQNDAGNDGWAFD